jgi:hypothetical protein
MGSKQRPLMKKEATLKYKGLKTKTSDEKRGNLKCKGLKKKTSNEKRGNPKTQNQKIENRQLAEASFTKLTLESKGEVFRFKLQSGTKVTHQTQKLRMLACRSWPY